MTALPNDADLLALCVWTEAQGEPADGMAAVARVVQNRQHLRYQSDGTLQGTILRRSGFSAFGFDFAAGAHHPAPDAYSLARVARMLAAAKASRAWAKCSAVVQSLQAGHYVGDAAYDRLTPETVLYDNPRISHPAWATPAAFVTAIGQHSFYRDLTWRPHAPSAADPQTLPDLGRNATVAAWSHPVTYVAAQARAVLGAAVTAGIKKAETSVGTVIGKIVTLAKTEWKTIEADIEADVATVQKALPASATTGLPQLETDVKQGASDSLSMVLNGAIVLEPEAVAALEAVLDGAFAKATGGAALSLVPILNNGLSAIGNAAVTVAQAWMLKKAAAAASVKVS